MGGRKLVVVCGLWFVVCGLWFVGGDSGRWYVHHVGAAVLDAEAVVLVPHGTIVDPDIVPWKANFKTISIDLARKFKGASTAKCTCNAMLQHGTGRDATSVPT